MANIPTTIVLAVAAVATWYASPFSDPRNDADGDNAYAGDTRADVEFGLCGSWASDDCVIDGDTFRMNGEKVRIAGIDTPETHPARCPYEKQLGMKATHRLRELLNEGSIHLVPIGRDRDVYGRLLRNVDGVRGDIGQRLIDEGLARPYGGGRRPWC